MLLKLVSTFLIMDDEFYSLILVQNFSVYTTTLQISAIWLA